MCPGRGVTRVLLLLILSSCVHCDFDDDQHDSRDGMTSSPVRCSHVMRGDSGTFTSPDYPRAPETKRAYLSCQWEVLVAEKHSIQMRFGDFNIEGPRDECDRGRVIVYEGVGKLKKEMDSYCPGNTADSAYVRNNTATVVFRWPRNFEGRGFLMSYIATKQGSNIQDFVSCTRTGKVEGSKTNDYSVQCPAGCGNIGNQPVWGGGCMDNRVCDAPPVYRDNSHLCRAAVHAGAISDSNGGRVNVTVVPGLNLYFRSVSNGIQTQTGSLSEYAFRFTNHDSCNDVIPLRSDQFSASSFFPSKESERKNKWSAGSAQFDDQFSAWSPADATSADQWLEIDLGKILKITTIITIGMKNPNHWCESYKIQWSLNHQTWHYYKNDHANGTAKELKGNSNSFSPVKNNFVTPPLVAQYIRIIPKKTRSASLRYAISVKLKGCSLAADLLPEVPATTTTTAPTTTTLPTTTTPKPTMLMTSSVDVKSNVRLTSPTTTQKETSTEPIEPVPGPGISGVNLIAIFAVLALLLLLIILVFVFIVRKPQKSRRMDQLHGPPAHHPTFPYPTTAQGADTGAPVRYMGDPKAVTATTISSTSSMTGNNGRVEYQNKHYRDANYITTSRGGVALVYNGGGTPVVSNSAGAAGPVPIRHSIPAQQTSKGAGMRQDSDSFESALDEEDHEYQVIPDYDLPVRSGGGGHMIHPTSSSKASTGGSSMTGQGQRETAQWLPAQHHHPVHPMWGTGGEWQQQSEHEQYPPKLPRQNSSRSGTFPHNNGQFAPESSNFDSFTNPRHQQRQRRKTSRSPQTTATSGSSTPLIRSSSETHPAPNFYPPNHHHQMAHFYPAPDSLRAPLLARHPSYDVPSPQQQPPLPPPPPHQIVHQSTFAPPGGEYPPPPHGYEHQQFNAHSNHSSLTREAQQPDLNGFPLAQHQQQRPLAVASSHAKQRNGYDHLHHFRTSPHLHVPTSTSTSHHQPEVTCTDAMTSQHEQCHAQQQQLSSTYNQLDLNSRV